MLDLITQEGGENIYQTFLSVEWLINNTKVKTFDPITFEGYQRQIDDNHARRIIEYINNNKFFFPTAIICSIDESESHENFTTLSIVDGQHRVHAFRLLKEENYERYSAIKDFTIPVILLENCDLSTEINTFITINKTSKKVDTSLAYVLRNKINKEKTEEISNFAKREYLSVEAARKLNSDSRFYIWNEKILFEGSIRNRYEYITLNGFVKSLRALLGAWDKNQIIQCNWDNLITMDELYSKIDIISDLVEFIWETVYSKWPELKTDNNEDSRIIQGTIGFTTINRYLINISKNMTFSNIDEYKSFVRNSIMYEIDTSADKWKKGGIYSKFSSESGYSAIVDDLLKKHSNY